MDEDAVRAAAREGHVRGSIRLFPQLIQLVTGTALLLQVPHVSARSIDGFSDDPDVYGYLSWRLEKVWREPSLDSNGNTIKTDAAREVSLPSLNLMLQYDVNDSFKTFVNLGATDAEEIEVRKRLRQLSGFSCFFTSCNL